MKIKTFLGLIAALTLSACGSSQDVSHGSAGPGRGYWMGVSNPSQFCGTNGYCFVLDAGLTLVAPAPGDPDYGYTCHGQTLIDDVWCSMKPFEYQKDECHLYVVPVSATEMEYLSNCF